MYVHNNSYIILGNMSLFFLWSGVNDFKIINFPLCGLQVKYLIPPQLPSLPTTLSTWSSCIGINYNTHYKCLSYHFYSSIRHLRTCKNSYPLNNTILSRVHILYWRSQNKLIWIMSFIWYLNILWMTTKIFIIGLCTADSRSVLFNINDR